MATAIMAASNLLSSTMPNYADKLKKRLEGMNQFPGLEKRTAAAKKMEQKSNSGWRGALKSLVGGNQAPKKPGLSFEEKRGRQTLRGDAGQYGDPRNRKYMSQASRDRLKKLNKQP